VDQLGVMNDTKWEEIRLAMYGLAELSPQWRTRDLENGFVSPWDGEWFYHFRTGGYATIEWLEIAIANEAQRVAVLEALRKIHVPGEGLPNAIRVYGYVQPGASVAYL
jgi:hypothetical protein